MILVIHPLGEKIRCILLGDRSPSIHIIPKTQDTARIFPQELVRLVDSYAVTSIWCITGPGPFTLMRIITLSINALAMTRPVTLKGIHFFDLIPPGRTPIIEANPRECIIRTPEGDVIIPWGDLPSGQYEGIFVTKEFTEVQDSIQYRENLDILRQVFEQVPTVKRLTPIYFKAPNITCSSKEKTSPSSVLENIS